MGNPICEVMAQVGTNSSSTVQRSMLAAGGQLAQQKLLSGGISAMLGPHRMTLPDASLLARVALFGGCALL